MSKPESATVLPEDIQTSLVNKEITKWRSLACLGGVATGFLLFNSGLDEIARNASVPLGVVEALGGFALLTKSAWHGSLSIGPYISARINRNELTGDPSTENPQDFTIYPSGPTVEALDLPDRSIFTEE